jgi:UDP-N-acetylglucosamine 1-carboxyvinyltransferase
MNLCGREGVFMERLIIEGGNPLKGELILQGAKNSVLPILAATILGDGESVIENCPNLRDVASAVEILRHLGCKVICDKNRVTVDPGSLSKCEIPLNLMREMRSSVIFLGAILGKCHEAQMSFPGGCELGPRPIDLHIDALKRLGVDIKEEHGMFKCEVKELCGTCINLSFPSVGATENIMLAGAVSKGITVIHNAAKEPEIEDLQTFLNKMGARIKGAGGSTIEIEGVGRLHGTQHRIMPDRIVAATYLTASAITGGDVTLHQANSQHLIPILHVFEETGCEVLVRGSDIRLTRPGGIKPAKIIQTMPHPGFPTDAQAIIMAYLTLAQGTSVFVETIFESRYKHVGELCRMGADIRVVGRMAVVYGVSALMGAKVECGDLRGGAALVIAALAAEGKSEVSHLHHIDRGYEKFEQNLYALGADIKRIE